MDGKEPALTGVPRMLTIPITRQSIRRWLLAGVVALSVVHLLGLTARHHLGHANVYGLIDRFHFDGEANVPSWYAASLLLACSVVVGLIAAVKRATSAPFARHWTGLAILLLLMAVDEGAQFHELLSRPMREFTDSSGGWLRYAWVIPGAIVTLLTGLAYLRFLLHLPAPTARRFVLAGTLFAGAAIGGEMVGGWYITTRENDFGYNLIASFEEMLEKFAVILALDAALAYLASQVEVIQLSLTSPVSRPEHELLE